MSSLCGVLKGALSATSFFWAVLLEWEELCWNVQLQRSLGLILGQGMKLQIKVALLGVLAGELEVAPLCIPVTLCMEQGTAQSSLGGWLVRTNSENQLAQKDLWSGQWRSRVQAWSAWTDFPVGMECMQQESPGWTEDEMLASGPLIPLFNAIFILEAGGKFWRWGGGTWVDQSQIFYHQCNYPGR